MKYSLDDIVLLAKDVELGDSIDWSGLNVDRDTVYQIIGSQIVDLYESWQSIEDNELILLATVTKLVVENYVLNLKVLAHGL